MAGTRLLIQTVVVLQLLGLTLWSLYDGLCRPDDVLCRDFWALLDPQEAPGIPQFEATLKPLVAQSDPELSLKLQLPWEVNEKAKAVCQDPRSPVTQEHPLWLCSNHQKESHMVVHNESLVVFYSTDDSLDALLLPAFKPRHTLVVHLIVEESPQETVSRTKEWAKMLENWISESRIEAWPCVQSIEVSIDVVSPLTKNWVANPKSSSDEENEAGTKEETFSYLQELSSSQVDSLLKKSTSSSSDENDFQLIVYIPSILPVAESSWKVGEQEFFVIPGSSAPLALRAVGQWLGSYMGLPVDDLRIDSDGSFPKWYTARYWELANEEKFEYFLQDFHRVRHLLSKDDKIMLPNALDTDPEKRYMELSRAHEQILSKERSTILTSEFPLEQYAAIFAPLLFPLMVPFIVALVKELKRYREKRSKKQV